MNCFAQSLLSGVKQYSHFLKSETHVTLHQAREWTAQAHGFGSWHELHAASRKNPWDIRLLACALSARSHPATKTALAVDLANRAAHRLERLVDLPAERCEALNRKARGLPEAKAPACLHHLEMAIAGRMSPEGWSKEPSGSFMKLNLFEAGPRFVQISGSAGWGKTYLANQMAAVHVKHGGSVCYVSPHVPSQLPPELSAASHYRFDPKAADGTDVPRPGSDGKNEREAAISWVSCDSGHPLEDLLSEMLGRLRQGSLVIIDEAHAFSLHSKQSKSVARQVAEIVKAGSVVIWVTQAIDDLSGIPDDLLSNALFLMGKVFAPTHLAPKEQSRLMSYLPPALRPGQWMGVVNATGKPPQILHLGGRPPG